MTNENSFNLDFLAGHDKFISITEKNVDIINSVLQIDSSYRNALDDTNPKSSAYIIRTELGNKTVFPEDYGLLKTIIEIVDRENSTHFSVAGNKSSDNEGIGNAIKKLEDENFLEDLKGKLEKQDCEVVDMIANAVEGRKNFSFATKLCHYIAYNALDDEYKDNYSIYDRVLSEVIPFYHMMYMCDENRDNIDDSHWITKSNYKGFESYNSHLFDYLVVQGDDFSFGYKKYLAIIEDIRYGVEAKTGYIISRNDLDHLLWYYYKGDKDLRKSVMKETYKLAH